MSTLLYPIGHRAPVPTEEATVRSTTEPIAPDKSAAENADAPEFNEHTTDSDPNIGGLATRQLGSYWNPSEKYPPSWADGAQMVPSATLINQQVATSGTAAAREVGGQFGHGTMGYAEGIEPTVRDGASFGAEYFLKDSVGPQHGAGDYMTTPPGADHDTVAAAGASARRNAQLAAQSSTYQAWYATFMNGG